MRSFGGITSKKERSLQRRNKTACMEKEDPDMYYGGRGIGLGWFDPTYLLLIVGALISLAASASLKSTFAKYSKIPCSSRITGRDTALRILNAAGIRDVQVGAIQGSLTDHYDPRNKTVSLSQPIFGQYSLIRSAIVPVANIGSTLSWPIFVAGLIFSLRPLTMIGIVLFSLAVLFQLVTLPVEFDASRRALKMLVQTGILGEEENKGARKVLTAAALTYVAALAASVLQLLRLIALANGGNRRDR